MMRRRTAKLMRNARFLGRRAKQMIMVLSDIIAMPAALWTAFLLHTGTASGDIRVRDVQGRVYIQSASGDVNLRDVEGSVLIKGASSDMDVRRLRGRLGVRTISGDLEIQQSATTDSAIDPIRWLKRHGLN